MASMSSATAATPVVLGAQEPRLCAVPEGVVSSAGQETVDLARLAGLDLDPWQELVLEQALGEGEDGRWAAFEVGLVVPRQNGKGSILEARELAGLFLFGEKLLIHSAHEQATSSEHFRRLLTLIEGVPEFERRVLKAPKGKGAEAIELRGGQRILFKTRTGGGGRGLTGDFVGLDEAMILPVATTAALVPTMAARSVSGNPQLWYAGSAVDQDKHEHGIVLASLRARGLAHAPRVAYFEWSADGDDPSAVPGDVRSDPDVWRQANPGLGIRISLEHVANECGGALGPREFAVERLGIGDWPDLDQDDSDAVISRETWAELLDVGSQAQDPVCFAIDVRPDFTAAAIGAAGHREDGLAHLEVVDHRAGTNWLVERLVELGRHRPVAICFDERSPAAAVAKRATASGRRPQAGHRPRVRRGMRAAARRCRAAPGPPPRHRRAGVGDPRRRHPAARRRVGVVAPLVEGRHLPAGGVHARPVGPRGSIHRRPVRVVGLAVAAALAVAGVLTILVGLAMLVPLPVMLIVCGAAAAAVGLFAINVDRKAR
jgi:hypothetical protein